MRLLITAFAALASPALAQEQEIVVTGRGLPQAPGEDVYATAALGRDRLVGSPSGRLDEILKEVPGFQLFRRSDARSANPTSQGATLRALGGNASSRALLLLDGVPQTDPFGGWISWPAYDPERLASVRVVRGGGSGANGPGALAGTIELMSAGPAEGSGPAGSLSYGSRDSVDLRASGGLEIGRSYASLSVHRGSGDGFIPVSAGQRGPVDRPSPYEQRSLSLRAVVPFAGAELQAGGLLFDDRRERGTAFSAIETEGADASLRLVGRSWTALAYVQKRDFYNSFASVNAARTSVTRASEQYSVPSTGLGARFEVRPEFASIQLRLGGDWRRTSGETRELFNFQNGVGTRRRIAGGETQTFGSFVEAAWERNGIILTGGARIDRWLIQQGRLSESLVATGGPLTAVAYRDRSGWQPTGRAGLAWRPAAAMTLRAAAYVGWRLPTLNELYRPFRVGTDATAANSALAPERLEGAEAGVEFRPATTARLGATVFVNRLEDSIANVTLARGPGTFPGVGFVAAGGEYRQRRNLDSIKVIGIELDGRMEFGSWTLSGGYGFADARVKASGPAAALNGLRPAQTPRHSAALTGSWTGGAGLRGSFTARYAGSQYEDDLNEQLIPDALTFDAAASAPVGRHFRLEIRGENLLDEPVVAGISGSGLVERATPRTLWIGLRLGDR